MLEGIPEADRIKATPKKPSALTKVSKLFNRNSQGKNPKTQQITEPKSGRQRIETAKKTTNSNSAYFSQGGSTAKKPEDTPLKSKAFAYSSQRGSRNGKPLQKINST